MVASTSNSCELFVACHEAQCHSTMVHLLSEDNYSPDPQQCKDSQKVGPEGAKGNCQSTKKGGDLQESVCMCNVIWLMGLDKKVFLEYEDPHWDMTIWLFQEILNWVATQPHVRVRNKDEFQ